MSETILTDGIYIQKLFWNFDTLTIVTIRYTFVDQNNYLHYNVQEKIKI